MFEYEIKYLVLQNNKSPIIDWLNSLDNSIRKRILNRIVRLQNGNFGDCKILTSEINELRCNFGAGYRIYYAKQDNFIMLLINGVDKSTQQNDIKKAIEYLKEWRNINGI